LDRGSRLLVIISVAVALVLEVILGARAWPPLRLLVALSFIFAGIAARWRLRSTAGVVLAIGILTPALFLRYVGHFEFSDNLVWTAGLFGVVAFSRPLSSWSFPTRWRAPLILWALGIALVWPIVVWRELDFTTALWSAYHMPNTGGGGSPPIVVAWVIDVSVAQALGLLWFDWLFATFPSERDFRRAILPAVVAAASIGSAVALYQYFGDIRFVSGSVWVGFHRAAGSLYDGNAFGMLTALLGGVLLALVLEHMVARWVGIGALALLWSGLWVTASRLGFIVAAAAVIAALSELP
jgi:hypothetical protein